jgi:glycosyltransferase involved in cell wall biosynthesis
LINILILHGPTSRQQGGTLTFLRNVASRLPSDRFKVTLVFLEAGGIADDFRRDGFAVEHGVSAGFDFVRSFALAIPARMVVTHSRYTRGLLPDRRDVPVVVVPLGVDTTASAGIGTVRGQIGADGNTPLVTMVGVFMPWKGQEVFIRAAALIRAQMPSARFLLVGDAPFERHRTYAEGLRRLVAELDLSGAVSFLGFRDDGAAIMAASDVVVHASVEPEPFGIVLLEAMATGRALVTTALGGAGEVVLPGESALVVPPGDAVALSDACVRLLKDPILRQQVADAGQRRVREKFSIEPMIDGLAARFTQAARAY